MTITGRPPKIDKPHPEDPTITVAEGIIRDLRLGIFKKHAAARAGVTEPTYHNWIARGTARLQRIEAFDREHPGALDCTHTWTDTPNPTCEHCDTDRNTWTDLTDSDPRQALYVDFLTSCASATATAVATMFGRIHAASRPNPPTAILDGNGAPVVIGGVVQVAKPDRGDWRAGAWLIERMDPASYHIYRELQLSGDPVGTPIAEQSVEATEWMDEMLAVAERLEAAGRLPDDLPA